MKGKKEWHASSTGPDWTDIARTSRELERLHEVWISTRVLNAGLQNSNGLRIVCAAFTNVLTATADVGIVTVNGEWPNRENASMEGLIYSLLLQLDYKLSALLWKQTSLPGTEVPPAH